MPRLRKTSADQRRRAMRDALKNYRERNLRRSDSRIVKQDWSTLEHSLRWEIPDFRETERERDDESHSMITIDLEENDDCVLVDDKAEKLKDAHKQIMFKKRLISKVHRQVFLYDNRHKLFSNVAKKELVWQKIAKELKSTVNVCKETWFELRYSYQRHARRLRNFFIHSRKENLKRPVMHLESELMFLWRFINNRKTCKIQFEIVENEHAEPDIETEAQKTLDDVEDITKAGSTEKEVECNEEKKTTLNQMPIDDDLILVEQPVELIVIDEDDDNCKSEKQFKLNGTMKMLISQIKTYPELYDIEHLSFKDYTKKSSIWNAIANNLGDKATKLMKCWIIMETRFEWEISQAKQADSTTTELQVQLEFLKKYILKNPETVYKQSYFLKSAWFDPFDYFKDIYNLIVRMKKMSDIVYITDSLLNTPEKNKQYLSLWNEIASLKGSTAGQCETTWLIMRHFYWELMHMRQQNYQLTDKWYFETIITELYAISKAAQTAKQQEMNVLKQNKTTKKAPKRSAQTNSTSLGAPNNKRQAPLPTTMQTTPTTMNNIQNIPATNSTTATQSVAGPTLTLPKITAAISLAPKAINTGTLQIKQIPGPPTLSPAPQAYSVPNFTAAAAVHSPTAISTPISMSFNLPTQTKVTAVPMPPLVRPLVSPVIQPPVRNTAQAMISVRPTSSLKPQVPLIPTAPKIHLTPFSITPTTTIGSLASPQMTANFQTSTLGGSNSNTTLSATSTHSIASYKITTIPLNSTTTNSNGPEGSTTTAPPSSTAANNSQLPKITGAISLLNPNEILIELIASQNGNQLVVHGPPLSAKYQLPMPTVAKLIREILAIPLLHNKQYNNPTLINYYWEHISSIFNLPVHICRACWNFLLENFNHFPQIAPLKELMKPFQTSLVVWKESYTLFQKFDEHCVSKGWLQYMQVLPEVVETIGCYPVLYQDIASKKTADKLSDMETTCVWRTISLRFPKISEIQEIWTSLKDCFCQYMTSLEYGIDNKWPINWWRSLARLKFLVEAKYSSNEPFYYIVSNKMVEEIEKCAMLEMKTRYKLEEDVPTNTDNENSKVDAEVKEPNSNDMTETNVKSKKEIELGALITAIQKYPVIYGKGNSSMKYEAWSKVAEELHMKVTDCLIAFKHATESYFAFKKQDVENRCRINEKYYKKLDDIIRNSPSGKFSLSGSKLNIKTPSELNKSLETDNASNDLVFPERYISDINMSNSPSNLVVKNWAFALGNINTFSDNSNSKLKEILNKYLPNVM